MTWLRFLLPVLLLCFITVAQAIAETLSSNQVKTAFVLNFAKFTQWPNINLDPSEQNLHLCVIGQAVLEGELTALQGRKAGKRQLDLVNINQITNLNEQQCQIVFIGKSEQNRLDELLHHLSNKSILSISDIEQFASKGGHIELEQKQSNIGFQINLANLHKSQLRLPGQVLNLATQVIK